MRSILLASAAFFAFTAAAHAENFTFTSVSTSFQFTLPSSPTPTYFLPGAGFRIDGVTATSGSTTEVISVAFYDELGSQQNGGFAYANSLPYFFIGPQVYKGTDATPTFVDGDYTLGGGASLDITSSSATPEPSSLALLGTGLLGTVGVLRKRFAA